MWSTINTLSRTAIYHQNSQKGNKNKWQTTRITSSLVSLLVHTQTHTYAPTSTNPTRYGLDHRSHHSSPTHQIPKWASSWSFFPNFPLSYPSIHFYHHDISSSIIKIHSEIISWQFTEKIWPNILKTSGWWQKYPINNSSSSPFNPLPPVAPLPHPYHHHSHSA